MTELAAEMAGSGRDNSGGGVANSVARERARASRGRGEREREGCVVWPSGRARPDQWVEPNPLVGGPHVRGNMVF